MPLLPTAFKPFECPGPASKLPSPAIVQSLDTTTPAAAEPPRLLLVEQAPAHLPLVESLSTRYPVEAAADGLVAWRLAQRRAPALVLIGVSIVGASSLALIHALRAHGDTVLVPIVILSASANRDLLLRCLGAGANNFLLKPFSPDELLACVRLELELHAPFAHEQTLRGPA